MDTILIPFALDFKQFDSLQKAIPIIAKNLIKKQNELNADFYNNEDIGLILATRSKWIDQILQFAWSELFSTESNASLIAVGGYGNQRLHPGSDIDLLILCDKQWDLAFNQAVERFIAFCWDCGIKLGISLRTLKECTLLAQKDLSIYTNLLSNRLLIGSQSVYQQFVETITQSAKIWPFEAFFSEKIKERDNRILHFQSSEYNLEPNIKDAPGTLRDLDLIQWLSLKKYQQSDFKILVLNGDIEKKEYVQLIKAQRYLWKLRYALHLVSSPPSNRLYFEYQEKLAKSHKEADLNQAVSEMMQELFEVTNQIRTITDVLCQHFHESFIHPQPIENNKKYQLIGNSLDVIDLALLNDSHEVMLMIQYIVVHQLKGFSAKTTHALLATLSSAATDFFENPQAHAVFLDLMNESRCAYLAINLMHRYNLLNIYIPEFKKITGQMQYDLYHIYTVDAHTLKLIENLANIFENDQESLSLFSTPPKPFVLIIAGLFHDISKGQGGHHAAKGKMVVEQFCHQHQLCREDTELIAWLVENHLLMSNVAQKKDITDESVIMAFAQKLQNEAKLSYLYLLTIADIQATNPALWNNWRKTLLNDLFQATLNWFNKKETSAPVQMASILNNLIQLIPEDANKKTLRAFFEKMELSYFSTYDFKQLAWQSKIILDALKQNTDYAIDVQLDENNITTQIFIYAKDSPSLFALLCTGIEHLMLTIATARITRSSNGYTIQTYLVMQSDMQPLNPDMIATLKRLLCKLLIDYTHQKQTALKQKTRHVPRRIKHLSKHIPVVVNIFNQQDKTVIEVTSPDFPGLLARIADVFVQSSILLHHAKINTLGERVEDVFYVTDLISSAPIADASAQTLEKCIAKAIKE